MGCSSDEAPSIETPRGAVTLTAGAFSVRLDLEAGDLSLRKGADVLLHFPLDGLELVKVAAWAHTVEIALP